MTRAFRPLDTLSLSLSNSVLAAWTQMETDTTIILHGLNPSGQLLTLKVNRDEDNTSFTFEGRTKNNFESENGQMKCGFTCISSTATLMPTETKTKPTSPPAPAKEKTASGDKDFNALHLLESVGSALQGLEDGVVVVAEGGDKGGQWIMTQDVDGQTVHVQNLDSSAVKAIIEEAESSANVNVVETESIMDSEKVFAALGGGRVGAETTMAAEVVCETGDIAQPGPSGSQDKQDSNKRLREEQVEEFEEDEMEDFDDEDGIVIQQEGEIIYRCYICNEAALNLETLQAHFWEIHGISANLNQSPPSTPKDTKPPKKKQKIKAEQSDNDVIFEVPFNKSLNISPSTEEVICEKNSRSKRYDLVAPDTPLEVLFCTVKKGSEQATSAVRKAKAEFNDTINTENETVTSGKFFDTNGDEIVSIKMCADGTEQIAQKEKSDSPVKQEIAEDDYVECRVCENKYTDIDSLTSHMQEVHSEMDNFELVLKEAINTNEMTVCFICGNQIRQHSLGKHLKEYHGEDIMIESTGDAESQSPTRQSSRIAGRQSKKDKKGGLENSQAITTCPDCHKEMRAYSLKTHQKEACPANLKVEEHGCQECSYVGKTERLLKIHIKNQHKKVDVVCKVCSKHFDTAAKMNIHLREVHQQTNSGKPVKLFQCLICNMQFVRKQRLVRHLKIHTGEKSTPCQLCGKLFRDKGDLRTHMRRTHLDDYPYRCDRCNIGLVTKKALEQHKCRRSLVQRRYKKMALENQS